MSDPSYLLIFRDASPEAYQSMSAEQRQLLLQRWDEWYERLSAAGKLEHGRPLEESGRVVEAIDGKVVDGPYVEAKETVGGYFALQVDSLEEATAIARECPGLRHGIKVEVRPVAKECPVLRATLEERVASEVRG